jgi:phosphoribosyl-AMP cyclohydrolase
MSIKIDDIKFGPDGLIPAIAQDYKDGTVLMLAYMNKESILKTLEIGEAVYFSRSRNELWHKGSTSGHFQKIKEIFLDCDQDTILLKVEQIGDIACHLGNRTCFTLAS